MKKEIKPRNASNWTAALCAGVSMAAFAGGAPALAQETQPEASNGPSIADVLGEEIVVTATKRESSVQDVPLAVTAYGAEQLDAQNFRDLSSLTTSMPNTATDGAGSLKGFANFSIRGLGVAGSIPSIEPTVGVFVDQVYLGIQSGVIMDNFDLEAVEVLRGPQGVLFGRNVTGGAILLRTTPPSSTPSLNLHAALETGLRQVYDGVATGPIGPEIDGKLAVYYSHDDGWFENLADGQQYGRENTFIVRPAIAIHPTDNLEFIFRVEYGESWGDGPAGQNHAVYDRDSFDFSTNTNAPYANEWHSASMETNWRVPFGNGTITNVFGTRAWRDLAATDSDGGNTTQLHFRYFTDQEQFSNELRYAGTFGNVEVTTGLYYFTQDLLYIEDRLLAGGTIQRTGGGEGTFDAFGAFVSTDWHLTDSITLNAGVRYNEETKDVEIGTVTAGGGNWDARTFVVDFVDEQSWDNVSPRIGIQFEPTEDTNIYAFYARGFRSGGYNFRKTIVGSAPGPFDPEEQDAYEIGIKQRFADGRGRINAAAFYNVIDNIQRDVQTPDIATGQIVQRILNAGEMVVQGAEAEIQYAVTDNIVLSGFVGYLNGEYQTLRFDLTGDGVINDADYALELPRLAPWTYGAAINFTIPLSGGGDIATRLAYSHRDSAASTDNNLGVMDERDIVDANITWTPTNEGHWSLGVYGSNLLDDAYTTQDAVLPDTAAFGGDGPAGPRPLPTFSPLARGRVLGIEARYRY